MKRYVQFKSDKNIVISTLELDKLRGLNVKPKNRIDAPLKVKEAKIINPSFIENILNKKNDKKIEYFLNYLMTLLNDDDSSEGDIALALDELERFRRQIINKQREYLEKDNLKKQLDRIKIIEEELKRKIDYISNMQVHRGKSR